MARVLASLVVVLLAVGTFVADPGPWSDAALDRTLARVVDDEGFVDYEGLVDDRADLSAYVERLAAVSPDSHPRLFPTREAELAYWMNAYNALMLDRVARAWPIDSVREIRVAYGVFWIERHRLGGRKWSLRGLENKIIRKRYGDPRIHFAINCASTGCPALPRRAWRGETLDADLDLAARRFVAHERNVRFDPATRTLTLSSIFKWFEEDFAPESLPEYAARYLPADRRAALGDLDTLEVTFSEYDWSINVSR